VGGSAHLERALATVTAHVSLEFGALGEALSVAASIKDEDETGSLACSRRSGGEKVGQQK